MLVEPTGSFSPTISSTVSEPRMASSDVDIMSTDHPEGSSSDKSNQTPTPSRMASPGRDLNATCETDTDCSDVLVNDNVREFRSKTDVKSTLRNVENLDFGNKTDFALAENYKLRKPYLKVKNHVYRLLHRHRGSASGEDVRSVAG